MQAWVDLKRQVDAQMQFMIADKLGISRDKLFTPERPGAEYWAVGLRNALHKGETRYRTTDQLADAIGSTRQSIRRYMELKDSVPQTLQNLIVEAMAMDHNILFSPDLPLDSEFKWAAKLRQCMREAGIDSAAALADQLDTEAVWVRAWMEQEVCGEEDPPYCGQVAPATQLALTEALGCDPQRLFRTERAAGDFRWVAMPRFGELVQARGGIGELARRLDLETGRIERWISGREPVAPETQLALLSDLGLSVEDQATLFTTRPPPDPARPDSAVWATGLRAAVRAHAGYRTLGWLAAEIDIPVQGLYHKAELLEPVPELERDRILRALGPLAQDGPAPFSTRGPVWDAFVWAPGLREALDERGMRASELATKLDVDLQRVQDWLEMEESPAATAWAKDKVKRGQLCPASRDAIIAALGGQISAERLFSATRPEVGALWAIKPMLELAVYDTDGKLAGFAEQIDVDPERVQRWIDQTEPVEAHTQARILQALGLEPDDGWQLFAADKRTQDGVG